MCTASVYKGSVALLAQALRTARAQGVSSTSSTTGRHGPRRPRPHGRDGRARLGKVVAVRRRDGGDRGDAGEAGLTPDLFHALAIVYAELAERAVAVAPEDVDGDIALETVLDRLSPRQTETESTR